MVRSRNDFFLLPCCLNNRQFSFVWKKKKKRLNIILQSFWDTNTKRPLPESLYFTRDVQLITARLLIDIGRKVGNYPHLPRVLSKTGLAPTKADSNWITAAKIRIRRSTLVEAIKLADDSFRYLVVDEQNRHAMLIEWSVFRGVSFFQNHQQSPTVYSVRVKRGMSLRNGIIALFTVNSAHLNYNEI